MILFLSIAIGLLFGWLSWKTEGYFITRRDRYIKSRFELFSNKIYGAIAVFLFITAIAFAVFSSIFK